MVRYTSGRVNEISWSRIAIARGTTCQGDPAITVILDRGWSKCAHKHSYSAKSGVASVIGYETEKFCS